MLDFLSIIADITRLIRLFCLNFLLQWLVVGTLLTVTTYLGPGEKPFLTHHVWYYWFDSGEPVVFCGCGPS